MGGRHLAWVAAALVGEPAVAADWSLDGSVTLASDYRTGGVSVTEGRPAIQAELTATAPSGFYLDAWVSSISPDDGGTVELDLSAGWQWQLGRVVPTVGVTAYLYPGMDEVDYAEGFATLAIPVRTATVSLTASYAPAQANLAEDDVWLAAQLEWPLPGSRWTIDALAAFEDGAFGSRKLEWQAGARFALSPRVELGAAYYDTRRARARHAGPTLIGQVTVRF